MPPKVSKGNKRPPNQPNRGNQNENNTNRDLCDKDLKDFVSSDEEEPQEAEPQKRPQEGFTGGNISTSVEQSDKLPENQNGKKGAIFDLSRFESAILVVIVFQSLVIGHLYYTRLSSSSDLSLNISSAVPDEIRTFLESTLSDIVRSNKEYQQETNGKLSDFERNVPKLGMEIKLNSEARNIIENVRGEVAALGSQIENINQKMKDAENLKTKLDEIVELKDNIIEMETEWKEFEQKTESSTLENQNKVELITSRQRALEDQQKELETEMKTLKSEMDGINDVRSTLEERLKSLESKMNNTSDELNKKLDGVLKDAKNYTDTEVTTLGGKIDGKFEKERVAVTKKMDILKQDIEKEVENKVKPVITAIERIDKIDLKCIKLETEIGNVLKNAKTYTDAEVRRLGENSEKERGRIVKNMDNLRKHFDYELAGFGTSLQNAATENNRKFSEMREGMNRDINVMGDNLKEKIGTSETEFQNGMKRMMDVKNYLEVEQLTLKSQADDTRQRVMPFETAVLWYIIYGVLILILFIITLVKKDGKKLEIPQDKIIQPRNQVGYQPSLSVLDKISPQTLQHEVCVLSFYKETQPRHERLARLAIPSGITIVTTLVDNYEDILKIPHSKTFLVFVDFNERNIILENPEQETGTLKYTTVQGVGKLGGDVILVYVRDNGSKTLKDGQLFNTDLTSVYRHKGLSSLNDKNRVLSIYDEFTQYQRSHISKIISETLNVKQ